MKTPSASSQLFVIVKILTIKRERTRKWLLNKLYLFRFKKFENSYLKTGGNFFHLLAQKVDKSFTGKWQLLVNDGKCVFVYFLHLNILVCVFIYFFLSNKMIKNEKKIMRLGFPWARPFPMVSEEKSNISQQSPPDQHKTLSLFRLLPLALWKGTHCVDNRGQLWRSVCDGTIAGKKKPREGKVWGVVKVFLQLFGTFV